MVFTPALLKRRRDFTSQSFSRVPFASASSRGSDLTAMRGAQELLISRLFQCQKGTGVRVVGSVIEMEESEPLRILACTSTNENIVKDGTEMTIRDLVTAIVVVSCTSMVDRWSRICHLPPVSSARYRGCERFGDDETSAGRQKLSCWIQLDDSTYRSLMISG
ncbi:hypothetical protein F443_04458 [Phytophthora nicotianae P1569]|uniref:Uncharacterized protein n=1 Tax=Phytophthora nicotianae P1569 TaxID=1317065 RepID=V9FLP0_PHYNI|nr:hypothetical protein F443_04458 [Phytophthora nicotianae P1569]